MGNKHSTKTHQPTFSQQESLESLDAEESTVTLVWYDPKMNSHFNYEHKKTMLSNLTNDVQFYVLESEFLDYMTKNTHTSVIPIISGDVARDILPKINDLKHIKSIHIDCDEKLLYQSLRTDFRKVKSISNGGDELKIVLETKLKHISVFSYYENVTQTSTWDLTKNNNEFIWFQFLQQEILLKQNAHNKQSKCDFIQRCREYRGNDYEADQQYINYLENEYKSKDAIREYTKATFLHNLINHAIRTGDIEELYCFRYYIAHLCTNVAKESRRFRRIQQKSGVTVLTLYRGQYFSQEEGEWLRTSEVKYIATRGFLSTTLDLEVAKTYADPLTENVPVLFEITVELDLVPSMILADISKFSLIQHEREVLFGLNATFEIDKQFLGDCGRWIIRMHATNRGQEITNDYLRLRKSEILNRSSSSLYSINFILAQLLLEMGQLVKAVIFLGKIYPTTNDERANLYFMLADANISSYPSTEHALNEGIRLLTKSKELFETLGNKFGVANTLRRHADALVLKEQCNEAIPIYMEAIDLYKEIPDSIESTASCYNGLADAYLGQRKYRKAELYYLGALNKRRKHLSDQHPAIARSYYSLGKYYNDKGNNNEHALRFLKEALERKKKIYPLDHPSIQCNQRLLEKVLAASAE